MRSDTKDLPWLIPAETPDDRITCAEHCDKWREEFQASRGNVARSYCMTFGCAVVRDVLRRCERFAPKKRDPDKRNGRQRWPTLEEAKWP